MAAQGYLIGAVLTAALVLPAAGLGRLASRRPVDHPWLRLLSVAAALELTRRGHQARRRRHRVVRAAPARRPAHPPRAAAAARRPGHRAAPAPRRAPPQRAARRARRGTGGHGRRFARRPAARPPGLGRVLVGLRAARATLLDTVLLSAAVGATGLLGHGHARQMGAWTLGLVALTASDTARSMGVGTSPRQPSGCPAPCSRRTCFSPSARSAAVPTSAPRSPVPARSPCRPSPRSPRSRSSPSPPTGTSPRCPRSWPSPLWRCARCGSSGCSCSCTSSPRSASRPSPTS